MATESLATGRSGDDRDAIYYRDGVTNSLAEWAMNRARQDVYNEFCRSFAFDPATTILDIGVSMVETADSNALERFYPYKNKLTCAGLGDGAEFKQRYSEVQYVRIEAGERLPFADQQFDIAYSNAVLEHVGGPEQRAYFLSEACRVAKAIFFAIPNHWFPIEHHSGVPLVHYAPSLFRRVLRNGKKAFWSDRNNVDFLSKSSLRRELASFPNVDMTYCGLRLGCFSSNVALVIKRQGDASSSS
jgi:SAM-dependent methyltransferase